MTARPVSDVANQRQSTRPGLVTCAISGLVACLAIAAVVTVSSPFAWAVGAVKQAIVDHQQAVATNFAINLHD